MPACSRVLFLGLVTLLVAWSAGVPALALQGESHGINVADMDLAVSPRVDFYRFANGGWLDRVDIPADRGFVAVRTEINDRVIAQQLDLLHTAAASGGAAPGSDEAKAGALFAQGLDMAARDRAGIAPIEDALARIAAIDSQEAYYALSPAGPVRWRRRNAAPAVRWCRRHAAVESHG